VKFSRIMREIHALPKRSVGKNPIKTSISNWHD